MGQTAKINLAGEHVYLDELHNELGQSVLDVILLLEDWGELLLSTRQMGFIYLNKLNDNLGQSILDVILFLEDGSGAAGHQLHQVLLDVDLLLPRHAVPAGLGNQNTPSKARIFSSSLTIKNLDPSVKIQR